MYFQNPQTVNGSVLAEKCMLEVDAYEASLVIEIRTVAAPWFTGVVQKVIPYVALSELDDFTQGTVVLGSYFPGYFWLEKDEE